MLSVCIFMHLFVIRKLLRVANEHFFGITSYSSISQNSGQEGRQCRMKRHHLFAMRDFANGRMMHVQCFTTRGTSSKMERLLDDQLNTNVQSSSVCRPCDRKVESIAKKKEVLTEQLKDLRAKYQTARNKTSRVKRLSKASPVPRARKKLRSPLTLQSSETGCEDNSDLENCFSVLPGDDHNNIEIKQSPHVAKDLSKVHPQTEMAINVTSECEPLSQEAPVQVRKFFFAYLDRSFLL